MLLNTGSRLRKNNNKTKRFESSLQWAQPTTPSEKLRRRQPEHPESTGRRAQSSPANPSTKSARDTTTTTTDGAHEFGLPVLAGRGATVGRPTRLCSVGINQLAATCDSLSGRQFARLPDNEFAPASQLQPQPASAGSARLGQRRLGFAIGNRFLMNQKEREREINQPFLIWRPTEMN